MVKYSVLGACVTLVVGVIMLMILGPSADDKQREKEQKKGIQKTVDGKNIEEITVDSCEYVVVSGSYAAAIVHKANCKNH